MTKLAVLAYSGGLDTTAAIIWLKKQLDAEVIALCVDVGQKSDFDEITKRAIEFGAKDVIVVDKKSEYAEKILTKAIWANALYEGRYPLVSALSRPVISEALVEAAERYSADCVVHGCTGKGNDQVRFEVSIAALAPDLEIIAPARSWNMDRAASIEYMKKAGYNPPFTKDKIYSIDENLWGRAIECGELEDPWQKAPEDIWELTKMRQNDSESLTITFKRGIPVAIGSKHMDLVSLIRTLNDKVGGHAWGRIDMVENRRVGIKSRETYEAPAALCLIQAHKDLEAITLERDLAHEKSRLEMRFCELAYDGLWHSPLMNCINEFMAESQKYVSGEVKIELQPNSCTVIGRKSPYSLYNLSLATYEKEDKFDQSDSEGFVKLWGLGIKTWAKKQGNLK
jgi:argininosuccinate synthase